jgi:hypothetical protein
MHGGIFFVEEEEEMMKTHIEDFSFPQLCGIIQSTKQSKPPNCDLGCHKILSGCYLK